MSCVRCRGFLVTESHSRLDMRGNWVPPAVRCVNCGYIDDPVFRANRLNFQSGRELDSERAPFSVRPSKEHPSLLKRKALR